MDENSPSKLPLKYHVPGADAAHAHISSTPVSHIYFSLYLVEGICRQGEISLLMDGEFKEDEFCRISRLYSDLRPELVAGHYVRRVECCVGEDDVVVNPTPHLDVPQDRVGKLHELRLEGCIIGIEQ